MAEKAMFPMEVMRVTQGYYTSYSHKQSFALDLGGPDGNRSKVYAPFSGTVQRIRSTNNEMWITSDEPVEWADGTVDYMTCLFIHANSIPVANGAHFNQGDWIYNEGNKGNVTGIHLHLECARGKWVSPSGYYNSGVYFPSGGASYAVWKIYTQVKPKNALFISDTTQIMDAGTDGSTGGAITWTKASSTVSGNKLTENTFFTVTAKNMQFMHTCDVDDVANDVAEGGYLTEGATYHALEQATAGGFTWWKFRYSNGGIYWTAMIDGRYTTEVATFDTSRNLTFTIIQQAEKFNTMDIWDPQEEKLNPGYSATVLAVSNKEYFGYQWFKFSTGSSILYIPKTTEYMTVVEGESIWENLPPDYVAKTLVGNVEYFNSPDPYDIAADQYLKKDTQYTAIQKSTEMINGFYWVKIIYTDDNEYYITNEESKIELGVRTGGPSGDYNAILNGLDVSKYQGSINWASVKADSKAYKFSINKCVSTSSSLYVDPYFEYNTKNAQAQGLATGAYIYTYATTTSYIDQEINLAAQQLQSYKMGYPIAWDCEDNSLAAACTPAQLTTLVLYALNKLKNLGFYPILYTYTNFANTRLEMSRVESAGFDVWIADYRGYCGYKGAYKIWQHTSTGSVSGISGNVDCNISYWDYNQYISDLGLNGFTGGSGGGGSMYPSTPMSGYKMQILKGNVQYFSYPSIYDENWGYFPQNGLYTITSKLNSQYDGFDFYTVTYNGNTVFTAFVNDGRMAIIEDEPAEYTIPYAHDVWSQKNKVIEDRNGHTQLFASPSVNAEPNKYLGLYKTCRNYALLQDTYDGYQFFAVIADGEVWYVAVLPDTDQYTTYTGEPYQREAVTDGTVFQVTGTGAYATAYPNSEATQTALEKDGIYSVSAKLTLSYNNMTWYVINVNGIDMYAPAISGVVNVTTSISYTEVAVDNYFRISAAADSAYAYQYANTSSTATKISLGTVLDPTAKLNQQYQNLDWYVVSIDGAKKYVPVNNNFNFYYEYSTTQCDAKFTLTVNGTMYSYDHASLNASKIALTGSVILKSKLNDTIEGKTWYTYQSTDGTTRYVIYDTENASYSYIYNTVSVPDGCNMNSLANTYKVFDHVTTMNGITVPTGTLIPLSGKVEEELISETWYVGTYSEQTVYCQDTTESDIVYVYTEEPVDEHLVLSKVVDKVKVYLYADKECPGYSELPINLTIKPLAHISNVSGFDWYKINFNNATLYICDDDSILKTMQYDSTVAIEGLYFIPKDGAIAYRYPNATAPEDHYALEVGKKYPVSGHVNEQVGGKSWISILYANAINLALGETQASNTNDTAVYVPLDELGETVYWYPNTTCEEGTVMEIMVEDSFKYYANPIDNQQLGLLQKGTYPAVAKLDSQYNATTWYIIQLDNTEVYAPLINGQSQVYVATDEAIRAALAELDAELHEIRTELDQLIPETSTLTLKVQKTTARMRTAELHIRTLKLYLDRFFS